MNKSERESDAAWSAAVAGDVDALGDVLGRIVAPLFDLAYHIHANETDAAASTTSTMVATIDDIRAPEAEPADLMLMAVRRLQVVVGSRRLALRGLEPAGADLPESHRWLVLLAWVADFSPAETGALLNMELKDARALRDDLERRLGESEYFWRERLDAEVAVAKWPEGMIERALELRGEGAA